MLAEIGLVLIIIGLLIQLKSVWFKKKEIRFEFLMIYGFGVALLAIDGFMNNLQSLAWLNLISFLVTILIIYKIRKSKR